MNRRSLGYWIATAVFCLAMGAGGVLNLIRLEEQQAAMDSLGYPHYLMTILGVAKILGVIALIIPGAPLLKEWAYAGFTFDLLGAAASHAFSGHAIQETIPPLVILAIMCVSYWLRPAARSLVSAAPHEIQNPNE